MKKRKCNIAAFFKASLWADLDQTGSPAWSAAGRTGGAQTGRGCPCDGRRTPVHVGGASEQQPSLGGYLRERDDGKRNSCSQSWRGSLLTSNVTQLSYQISGDASSLSVGSYSTLVIQIIRGHCVPVVYVSSMRKISFFIWKYCNADICVTYVAPPG